VVRRLIGVFGGYGGVDATARDYDPLFEVPYSGSGALGGAQAGYDWQQGPWVFGLAADAAVSSVDATAEFSGPVVFKIRQQWEAALRGRIGHAFGSVLPYVTAGVAFSGFETKYSQLNLPYYVTDTDRVGVTVGAGAEIALSGKILLVSEYRYTCYGTEGSEIDTPDGPYTIKTQRATIGINFRY